MNKVTWERLCSIADIADGEIKEVTTPDGSPLIVLRTDTGSVKVFQGHCPHQKRSLADGYLDENLLTCSAHMWQFDVETGAGVNGTACGLASYPVRIEAGEILADTSQAAPRELWRS